VTTPTITITSDQPGQAELVTWLFQNICSSLQVQMTLTTNSAPLPDIQEVVAGVAKLTKTGIVVTCSSNKTSAQRSPYVIRSRS
jgi:hypothetical protein